MKEALSEERKTIAWAISSGFPTRFSGTVETKPIFPSSVFVKRFSIGISIGPGAMAFTCTPVPAASSAADFVSPLAAYIGTDELRFCPFFADFTDQLLAFIVMPTG